MRHLGLTTAQRAAWQQAQRDHGMVSTVVDVLDLEGNQIDTLDDVTVNGQVLVDRRARVSRALMLDVLDPRGVIDFGGDSPDPGTLYFDKMLSVSIRTWVAAIDMHVVCPVFTGPVSAYRRDGASVRVEGHGKEELALGSQWDPMVIKAGTPKTDAIKLILDRTGETRYALPDLAVSMPHTMNLGRTVRPWRAAQRIAESMGRQLYYRADGYVALRRPPAQPVYTFSATAGDPDVDPATVQMTETMAGFANVISVVGGKPRGPKTRVRAVVEAPPHHAMSPANLGRGSAQRRYVHRYENRFIRSHSEAHRVGLQILEDRLRSVTQPRFDSLPIYHAEEGDLVQIDTDDAMVAFRLDRFSLPIGTRGDFTMPVGYTRPTTRLREDW